MMYVFRSEATNFIVQGGIWKGASTKSPKPLPRKICEIGYDQVFRFWFILAATMIANA